MNDRASQKLSTETSKDNNQNQPHFIDTPHSQILTQTHLTEAQQSYADSQNGCPLCGTNLEIQTDAGDLPRTVQEQAHCPSCQVLARIKTHTWQ